MHEFVCLCLAHQSGTDLRSFPNAHARIMAVTSRQLSKKMRYFCFIPSFERVWCLIRRALQLGYSTRDTYASSRIPLHVLAISGSVLVPESYSVTCQIRNAAMPAVAALVQVRSLYLFLCICVCVCMRNSKCAFLVSCQEALVQYCCEKHADTSCTSILHIYMQTRRITLRAGLREERRDGGHRQP